MLKLETAKFIAPPVFAAPAAVFVPVPVVPDGLLVPLTPVTRDLVPEAVALAVDEPGAADKLAYNCADWKGVQLDDAGTLGV